MVGKWLVYNSKAQSHNPVLTLKKSKYNATECKLSSTRQHCVDAV